MLSVFLRFLHSSLVFYKSLQVLYVNPGFHRCLSVNQYLRHNLGYKQKIQVLRHNQVYFSSSNVSTDTTVIFKD